MTTIFVEGVGPVEIKGDAPTAAEIDAIIKFQKQSGVEQAIAKTSVEPSELSESFTSGVNQALMAELPGAALDLPSMAVNAGLSGIETVARGAGLVNLTDLPRMPVTATETLSRLAEQTPLVTPAKELPPATSPARAAGRVIGAGLPLVAGPLVFARSGKIIGDITRTAANAPGRFAAIEAAGIQGAAVGAAAAEVLDPGNPILSFGLELLGGILSPAGIAGRGADVAATSGKRALTRFSSSGRESEARTVIENVVSGSGESIDEIRQRLAEAGPAVASQRTGSRALSLLEQHYVAKSGAKSEELRQLTQAAVEEINRRLKLLAQRGDAESLHTLAKARLSYVNALIAGRIDEAQRNVANALDGLSPDLTRQRANQIARTELDQALTQARTQENAEWGRVNRNVDLNDVISKNRESEEGGGILNAFDEARADLLDEESLPAPIEAFVNRVRRTVGDALEEAAEETTQSAVETAKKPLPPIKSGDLIRFRSRALEIARELRANNRFGDARRVQMIADGVLDDLTDPAFDEARAFSRALNERFTQDRYVSRILGFNRQGGQIDPDLTLELLMARGGPEAAVAARTLRTAVTPIGGDEVPPQMKFAQEQFLRDQAHKARNPQGFAARNEDLLRDFPDTAQAVAAREAAELEQRQVVPKLQRAGRTVERQAIFSRFAGVEDAKPVIADIMFGKQPFKDMRSLMLFARRGGPKVVESVRAQALDVLLDRAVDVRTGGLITESKLTALLSGGMAEGLVQSGLVTAPMLKNVRSLAKEAGKIEQSLIAKGRLDEGVAEEVSTLFDLGVRVAGANLGGASALGQVSGAPLVLAGAGVRTAKRFLEKIPAHRVQDVIVEALLDSRKMADLLAKPGTAQLIRARNRRIEAWLLQMGVPDQPEVPVSE